MLFKRELGVPVLFEEMMPLLTAHYKEIAQYLDIPLNPNFEKYALMELAGTLRIYTARAENGLLVGYAYFFVNHNIHYQDSLQALQDVIYVDRELRGNGIGKEFIKWCEEQLRADGVQAIYQHVKNKHNFGPMLETMGYELVDLIYAKRLDVANGS